MKYRPEIDGLRAIAIIPVILFHVGFDTFSGGYTGVDVFFVISGFLITTIIYSELENNTFSIINFYERRARRILPLLFFVLLTTIPFAWLGLFQVDLVDYFDSLISTPLFYSNFLFAFEANYFDASVDLKPLLHTWSLSVEEQYYIFFPIFMIALWRLRLRKVVIPLLIMLSVSSFIFCEWASASYPEYNFFLLPSRFWELACGALLSIATEKSQLSKLQNNPILSEILSITGLLLIIFSFFIIKEDIPFPSKTTLLPTLGTVLVIGFSNQNNLIGRMLSLRFFVFIGLISYSAYLWHHPLFSFYKHMSSSELSFTQKMLLTILVIPLSYLSHKYIENPFRNKKKFGRKFIFIFTMIGSCSFICFGYLGIMKKGFPNRPINTRLNYLNYFPDNRQLKKDSWSHVNEMEEVFGNKSWYDSTNTSPNVLLVGNSHSKDMYNAFLSSKHFQKKFELARFGGEIRNLADIRNNLYASENFKESDIVMIVSHYYEDDLTHIEGLVKNLLLCNKKVVLVREPYKYKIINARTVADIRIQNYLKGDTLNRAKDSTLVYNINQESYTNRIIEEDKLKEQADILIDKIKRCNQDVIILDRNNYISNQIEHLSYTVNNRFEKFNYDSRHTTLEGAQFFGKRIDEVRWLDPIILLFKS